MLPRVKEVAVPPNAEEVSPTVEREVIAALESGDRTAALHTLMKAYGDIIYIYCLSRLRNPADVEEVHREIFVQAYDALDQYSRASSVRKWLFGIARHRCIDAARVIKRAAERMSFCDSLPEAPDPRPLCDEELEGLELAAMVTDCINRLKKEERVAVLLHYQDGLHYNEIGRICRENPSTLQRRVSRAIEALRECLKRKGAHL